MTPSYLRAQNIQGPESSLERPVEIIDSAGSARDHAAEAWPLSNKLSVRIAMLSISCSEAAKVVLQRVRPAQRAAKPVESAVVDNLGCELDT